MWETAVRALQRHCDTLLTYNSFKELFKLMTGAQGGTHYQDKDPQKFRQELFKDVSPQAKSLLHLPLILVFHVDVFFLLRAEQTADSSGLCAGCCLPVGAIGPCSPQRADTHVKLSAAFSSTTTRGLLYFSSSGSRLNWKDLTLTHLKSLKKTPRLTQGDCIFFLNDSITERI